MQAMDRRLTWFLALLAPVVVWSWIGRKLVIWAASAKKWLPNETINDMVEVDRDYSPIAIGFEEDGLNEWGLQPIRTEQVARGVILPLRPLKAPKGKLDFIRGLQPYFRAGEVEFVNPKRRGAGKRAKAAMRKSARTKAGI